MKYFVIVDMQNDFVTGALKNDAAKAIIPGIVAKAKELKEKGYTIIATRDTHQKNYMSTQEGKNLPVEHCIEGSDGWKVVDEIKPLVDEYVDKPSFGFIDWKDTITEFLKVHTGENVSEGQIKYNSEPEEIAMCGTVTSICVASNFSVLKASYPEVPITVYKDLCAGLTPETHEAAITVMKTQQAIIV